MRLGVRHARNFFPSSWSRRVESCTSAVVRRMCPGCPSDSRPFATVQRGGRVCFFRWLAVVLEACMVFWARAGSIIVARSRSVFVCLVLHSFIIYIYLFVPLNRKFGVYNFLMHSLARNVTLKSFRNVFVPAFSWAKKPSSKRALVFLPLKYLSPNCVWAKPRTNPRLAFKKQQINFLHPPDKVQYLFGRKTKQNRHLVMGQMAKKPKGFPQVNGFISFISPFTKPGLKGIA